jgi:hypothetical protein
MSGSHAALCFGGVTVGNKSESLLPVKTVEIRAHGQ